MRDDSRIFSSGGPCEQLWHGQGCPLFDVVHPAFLVPTSASPTLQGSLKDGLGEAITACDMSEPCKFSSLDSCQKRFLWTLKEADSARHRVIGFMLHAKCPHVLDLESWDPFLQSQLAGSMFYSPRGGGRWQETYTTWTCLWSWWCCSTRSWKTPTWPLVLYAECGAWNTCLLFDCCMLGIETETYADS